MRTRKLLISVFCALLAGTAVGAGPAAAVDPTIVAPAPLPSADAAESTSGAERGITLFSPGSQVTAQQLGCARFDTSPGSNLASCVSQSPAKVDPADVPELQDFLVREMGAPPAIAPSVPGRSVPAATDRNALSTADQSADPGVGVVDAVATTSGPDAAEVNGTCALATGSRWGTGGFNRTLACARYTETYTLVEVSTRGASKVIGQLVGQRTEILYGAQNTVKWKHGILYQKIAGTGNLVGVTLTSSVNCHLKCDYSFDGRFSKTLANVIDWSYDVTSRIMPARRAPLDVDRIDTTRVTSTMTCRSPQVPNSSSFRLPESPPYRCDNTSSDYRTTNGCVYPDVLPNLVYSLTDTKDPKTNVAQVAKHVQEAQQAGFPGSKESRRPLRRLTSVVVNDANRRQAQAMCAKMPPRPPGTQCDEYPFAATKNRGPGMPVSVKFVDGVQNNRAGIFLRNLMLAYRMLDNDSYWVVVVP